MCVSGVSFQDEEEFQKDFTKSEYDDKVFQFSTNKGKLKVHFHI